MQLFAGVVQEPSSQVAEAAEGGEGSGREVKEGWRGGVLRVFWGGVLRESFWGRWRGGVLREGFERERGNFAGRFWGGGGEGFGEGWMKVMNWGRSRRMKLGETLKEELIWGDGQWVEREVGKCRWQGGERTRIGLNGGGGADFTMIITETQIAIQRSSSWATN